LRELLQRHAERPFAILGIYCDEDLARAKERDEALGDLKETLGTAGMTWPSFKDDRNGPISTAWNVNSWPRLDVLDRKGVIRYRNLYGEEIAQAVETLLHE